jgi:UDP-N-acetylmuramoylalanine--D-glutamate ligase
MDLDIYKNKKILILGLGREGVDSLRFFLKNCPKNIIAAADKSQIGQLSPDAREFLADNPQIKLIFGENYLADLDNYDLIVKSPGIPIHIPEIEKARKFGKITSQTEIFFKHCPGAIIGITGTKGKSTTSSIIHDIVKRSGGKVFLLGNIGTPMLSYLLEAGKDTVFVCELSAHQLFGLKRSPHIAVLLNIYPEHLDYYSNYNEYIRAKANIAIYQSKKDYLIYNSANFETSRIAQESIAKKIAFNEYEWIFNGKTNLIGDFNFENAKIGAIVGRLLGISDKIIKAAISEFQPLASRLEYVGNFNGIDCYNDSLSTIQESAVAAISGLGDRVCTLIAGGFDRGQPFDKLAAAILESKIKNLIFFPTTGKKIWQQINTVAEFSGQTDRLARLNCFFVENMNEAVGWAFSETKRGCICLLSAASASFKNFRDYADRGDQFKKYLAKRAGKRKK